MASKKIKKDVLVEKENKRDKTVAVDDVSIVEVLDSHDKNADDFKSDIVESSMLEETKIEKKKRFWDEVKSFFILVIIIGLVILVGYLFIKYAKPIEWKKNDENKDEIIIKDNEKYNVLSYVSEVKDSSLKLINNKYLVEYSGKNITKIMDIDLNILYESDEDEKYIISEGVDGKFYAYTNSDLEEGLVLNLYVLENEKLVEVKEFAKTGVYYVPLYTDNYLVGIVGNNCYLNEDLVSVCDTSLFTLDEKERTLSNL
jgi:hypothetical protein